MNKLTYFIPIAVLLLMAAWWTANKGKPHPHVIALVQLTEVDGRTVNGFKAGMAAAGYREGVDVVYRSQGPAGKIDRLDEIVRQLLSEKPDLFMVSSTPATQAVKRLTEGTGIPVVFAPVNDPLSAGIVSDLRQPGGNITGVRLPTGDDLRLKWLQEIAPNTHRVLVPYTPGDKSAQASLEMIAGVAPALAMILLPTPVQGRENIAAMLAAMPDSVDAIFLPRDSSIEAQVDLFVAVANERRLPLSAPSLIQVEQGALMSYGFNHHEIGRQAARLADQILRGIKPGDLPVEMAESMLSINSVTARRIDLTVPENIMRQADTVIRE